MREKASEIYQKLLKDEQAISDIDIYNDDVAKIIEIISNECKSTVIDEKGQEKYYGSFLKKDVVKNLVIQFLKNDKVASLATINEAMYMYYAHDKELHKDLNETPKIGPILKLSLEKKLSQDGEEIEKVFVMNTIANDIGRCIIGIGAKQGSEIRKAALEPYAENLINSNEELISEYPVRQFLNKILGRKKDPNRTIKEYTKSLSRDFYPEIAENTATYIVKDLLENEEFSKEMEEKAKTGKLVLDSDGKSKGYTDLRDQIVSEIVYYSRDRIVNPKRGIDTINQIYSDVLAQFKVMTNSLENKEPEEIEKFLKELNKTILPPFTKYAENGYRGTELVIRSETETISLVPKIYVEQAMKHLTSYIAQIVSNKDNMSKEEYIKETSRIHNRFITIHPFPDGNGRTGRAIINMMLEPIGESVVFNKEQRDRYVRALDFQRGKIDREDRNKYLENLYNNPEECTKYEEGAEYLLEEFIGERVGMDYSDRGITQDLTEVIEQVQDFER